MSDTSDHPDDELQARRELEELRRLASYAHDGDVTLEAPPDEIWDRIAAEAFGDDASAPSPTPSPAAVPMRRLDRTPRPWLLGVAAAMIVVVGAFVVATRPSTDGTVVATVELEQLADAAPADGYLVDDDDGFRLRLDATDPEAPSRFAEVWLINEDLTEVVSLGPVREDGSYVVPAGLDPQDFPVVDVSLEPFDGDPAHSGDSVLRGVLEF